MKFDGEFLLHELFRQGFTHNEDNRKLRENEFSTLISDTRLFYEIRICYGWREKNNRTVTIQDSLKVLPFSVDKVAKAFNLPIDKLTIDYEAVRAKDYTATDEEIKYLYHDCKIVGDALKTLQEQGMDRMTAASNSLAAYKQMVDKKRFRKIFPVLACDADIRKSYRGGYVYVNPLYQGKEVADGLVFDVNSLYPSRMRNCKIPMGEPKRFEGAYVKDKVYDLYVQYIRVQFKLKERHVPTIQIKKSSRFAEHEYVCDSGDEEVILCLTSIDLEIFLEHYDVFNLEYLFGYKFRSSNRLFTDFVDYWMKVKVDSEVAGNAGMRTLAKLIMNSLYGKWAVSPDVASSLPYYEDGLVRYQITPFEEREPLYIPAASFITAHARALTIKAIQANYDRFLYADTDSIHLMGVYPPVGIEVDETKLGAWKWEMQFSRAKYLRPKCYMEDGYDPKELKPFKKVTIAGMSDKLHKYVTFDNFNLGVKFSSEETGPNVVRIDPHDSNLRPIRVPGGVVLVRKDFTLQL